MSTAYRPRRTTLGSLGACLLVVAGALVGGAAQAADTASVSGTVRGPGGTLSGVCVQVYDTQYSPLGAATTGAGGAYSVGDLPAGSGVKVRFEDCSGRDLAVGYNGGATTYQAASAIALGNGATGGVDRTLSQAAHLTGTVTGPNGPTGSVCVDVYETTGLKIAGKPTASNGRFDVGLLPAGPVEVQFADCANRGLVTEWYSDKPTLATGDLVTVTPGTPKDITAALDVASGTIKGRVVTPGGAGATGVCVSAYATDGITPRGAETNTEGDGTFQVNGVSAGSVKIEFRDCLDESKPRYATEWYDDQPTAETATLSTVSGNRTLTLPTVALAAYTGPAPTPAPSPAPVPVPAPAGPSAACAAATAATATTSADLARARAAAARAATRFAKVKRTAGAASPRTKAAKKKRAKARAAYAVAQAAADRAGATQRAVC